MKCDNIFISLEEASQLENTSYHNILMRIQRKPEKYNIKKETS